MNYDGLAVTSSYCIKWLSSYATMAHHFSSTNWSLTYQYNDVPHKEKNSKMINMIKAGAS